MNRIILFAQLLGALLLTIACTAIADPGQGEIRRIKQVSGDEAGTLKGRLKWGDVVLKARAIRPEGGTALRESGASGPRPPVKFEMLLDWTEVFVVGRSMEAFNQALKANFPSGPGELEVGARRVTFTGGLITEVKFPALDGASKEPAYLTVKMSAEIAPSSGAGTPVRLSRTGSTAPAPPSAEKQKSWNPANFRLSIGGLNTSRVKHMSHIPLKPQTPAEQRRSGETSLGDLVLPEADFKSANLVKWEGPDFDATKNEIRARPVKVVYFDETGRVLGALKFRLVGLGRIKSLPGGMVQVGMRLSGFELAKN